MKILRVNDYNQKAYTKYVVNLNRAIEQKDGGIPYLSWYVVDKKTGYVVYDDNSSKWFSNKQKAIEYVDSLEEKETNK
jgi:hypothetical protein